MPEKNPHPILKPGEVCIYCGSVGQEKPKPEPPPCCDLCEKDFSRANGAWRIYRGKRRHIACIERKDSGK